MITWGLFLTTQITHPPPPPAAHTDFYLRSWNHCHWWGSSDVWGTEANSLIPRRAAEQLSIRESRGKRAFRPIIGPAPFAEHRHRSTLPGLWCRQPDCPLLFGG